MPCEAIGPSPPAPTSAVGSARRIRLEARHESSFQTLGESRRVVQCCGGSQNSLMFGSFQTWYATA